MDFWLATADTATWFGKEYRFFGLDWSYLKIIGFLGNGVFFTRFLVQWIASERSGRSVVPVSFWHWSIVGSVIMCVYWILEREPVGILGYLPNTLVYMRNLHLIKKQQAATPPQPAAADKQSTQDPS